MSGPWDDLFDVCAEWLAAIQVALSLTEGGSIQRAYVSPPGQPIVDMYCEQLTVSGGYAIADTLPLIPPLSPGHRTTIQGGVILAPLVATVLRCVPTLDDQTAQPPSLNELETAAVAIHSDLWAILNHTWNEHHKGVLFAPRERELFLDPAVPVSQAGGVGGWQIQVRVELPGYIEAS